LAVTEHDGDAFEVLGYVGGRIHDRLAEVIGRAGAADAGQFRSVHTTLRANSMAAGTGVACVDLAALGGIAGHALSFGVRSGEREHEGDEVVDLVLLHLEGGHGSAGNALANDAADILGRGAMLEPAARQRRPAAAAAGEAVTEGAVAAI